MSAAKMLPSREYLNECFDYDSETGALTWKVRPYSHFKEAKHPRRTMAAWNARHSGKPAGCISTRGYIRLALNGCRVRAHRIIWKLIHDEDPIQIDHINRNTGDNRLVNLRVSDQARNSKNRSKNKNNTSGINGVHWSKEHDKWRAKITVDGNMIHLGIFTDKDDAIAARLAAEQEHGYDPTHGK